MSMSMIDKKTKVISPIVVSDAMLVSSTAAESDYAAWVATTNYTVGTRCIRAHRIYENLIAGVNATPPEDAVDGDTTRWLEIGPTNRWAMFDGVVGTVTKLDSGPLTVVLAPGRVSGLAMMELVGKALDVTMRDSAGGVVVYSRQVSLDGTIIDSLFDWFYASFEQRTDVVLADIPSQFPDAEITLSITGAGIVGCGVCVVGEVVPIGASEYGAKSWLTDYSVKTRDEFGRYSVVERSYSKGMTLQVITEGADFNRIARRLAALRATPCVWIATESRGYEPLIVYGFYKDFSIEVAYQSIHYCSLEIEGLI